MHKSLEKCIGIALATVSTIFVVFLLVLITNTNVAVEADNSVVHALFIVLTLAFATLTAFNVYFAFSNMEKVNQVLLFKTKNTVQKASVGVIRKLAKKATADIEGIKINKINLFTDATGEVTFKAAIKVKATKGEDDIKATELLEEVSTAIEKEILEVLGLQFKEIELKLIKYKKQEKAPAPAEQAQTPAYESTEQDANDEVETFDTEIEETIEVEEVNEDEVEETDEDEVKL